MKRITALVLLLAMALAICGCSTNQTSGENNSNMATLMESDLVVTDPMEYPLYTFDHEPTVEEMRQMAVKAMEDMLSIQWYTPKFMTYQKTGAVSGKIFIYAPDTMFCGLPYTNGDSAIFNWFEYYDQETGKLNFEGSGMELNDILGNTCTGSIMWAWAAVCDSLKGSYVNFNMVPKWGCYPVGNYVTQYAIDSYLQYSTQRICEDNGKEVMYECYALMQPADAVSSSPADHGMMIREAPVVVRNPDGSINPDESYVMIQDQRGGSGRHYYEVVEEGVEYLYSGRVGHKYTFTQLYAEWYVPVTPSEFMGDDPYMAATVEHTNHPEITDLSSLLSGDLVSNFPMCIIKVIATDESGNETTVYRAFLDKTHVRSGLAREYPLSEAEMYVNSSDYFKNLKKGKSYNFRIDVTVSTGEVFTIDQVTIVG